MEKDFLTPLAASPEAAEAIWERHRAVVADYESRLAAATRSAALDIAIAQSGGRNAKAIRALIDEADLGDDPAGAREAVARVRRDNPYLFALSIPTAPGTGAPSAPQPTHEELSRMSLSDYRRYRRGQ